MSELKPCPFCGQTDVRISGTNTHAYAYCQGCSAEGPYNDFTAEQAIESWNRRTPQPVTPAGVEVWHWKAAYEATALQLYRRMGNDVERATECARADVESRTREIAAFLHDTHPPVADAALVRDAERYRWIRRSLSDTKLMHSDIAASFESALDSNDATKLDAAIDAALNQREQNRE